MLWYVCGEYFTDMDINGPHSGGEGTDVAEVYSAGNGSSAELCLDTDYVESVLICFDCSFFCVCYTAARELTCHTLSQPSICQGLFGATEAQLATDHGGGFNVPVVITHCAPFAVLQHLHSPLANHGSAP